MITSYYVDLEYFDVYYLHSSRYSMDSEDQYVDELIHGVLGKLSSISGCKLGIL